MIFWLILIALIVAGVGSLSLANSRPGQLDSFAQCLKDEGVTFYGAFWCPHCQKTKGMFGRSAKLLPYVECSTADTKGQTQICIDEKITSYPTWTFAGTTTRLTGERTLSELAAMSGCQLPQ